ncbi:MAG: oxygen-insensitive NADPH nitroreductase [Alphaproteobacteria bacterium]|nr:oxygen-insensitive NADPH nitroreductase [Alphaproteobacteria bacterium]
MNMLLETMRAHTSVRSFKDEPIDSALRETIFEAAQHSSTSSHIQAYTVIRVQDKANREIIKEAAGGQPWISAAPEFFIFCADLNRLSKLSDAEGLGTLDGLHEHSLAAVVDVALYAQSVLLAAESLGLGGVFIGGIRNNPDAVIKALALPELVYPVFGMCLGWPKNVNDTKPRLPLSEILYEDSYQTAKRDENIVKFNVMMDEHYKARDTQDDQNWNMKVSQALQTKKRVHMKESLNQKGFFKL